MDIIIEGHRFFAWHMPEEFVLLLSLIFVYYLVLNQKPLIIREKIS